MESMDGRDTSGSLDQDDQSKGKQPDMGQGMPESSFDSNLVSYLEEHNDGERFLLAVSSAKDAYSFMLNKIMQ
ncbi:MAG: hypothetical protein ACQEWV_24385 [Bacillota bacterium]